MLFLFHLFSCPEFLSFATPKGRWHDFVRRHVNIYFSLPSWNNFPRLIYIYIYIYAKVLKTIRVNPRNISKIKTFLHAGNTHRYCTLVWGPAMPHWNPETASLRFLFFFFLHQGSLRDLIVSVEQILAVSDYRWGAVKALQRRGSLKVNIVAGIREFDLGWVSKVATQAAREEWNSTSGGWWSGRKSKYQCQTAMVCSVCIPRCKKPTSRRTASSCKV